MKVGKAPGPDGFSLQYFKTFKDILKPNFLAAFCSFDSSTQAPSQMLEAHRAVIPKEGKDASLVKNYRPISLINVDVKIYAKILANRLLPLLPSLISLDQVGFIPGREGRDNTIKALNIHHWLNSCNRQGFFLSLYVEKAFDRVAWDCIDLVLTAIGIPNVMQSYIRALYSSPTVRVCANGHLLNAFQLHNGTGQGCPLSPINFVLTLEPLLNKIRLNPDIKGITIKKHKLPAFADDLLLFLSDPHISIPNLLKYLKHFQTFSNLKIKYSKSNALNITLPPKTVAQCQKNLPFNWAINSITYLGIKIPKSLLNLFQDNFTPALKETKEDLKRWDVLNVSWFGRASLKMTILPWFLHLLQTIPIQIPISFFNSFRQACSSFFWRNKPPRIKFDHLTLPKDKGGIALPDLRWYYWAIHLTRIVDWNIHQAVKDWVTLEHSITPPNLEIPTMDTPTSHTHPNQTSPSNRPHTGNIQKRK